MSMSAGLSSGACTQHLQHNTVLLALRNFCKGLSCALLSSTHQPLQISAVLVGSRCSGDPAAAQRMGGAPLYQLDVGIQPSKLLRV